MEINRVCQRKAIKSTPQLREFKKMREKSKLPKIEESFSARESSLSDKKAEKIWDETDEYVRNIIKFITLAKEAPRSTAAEMCYTDSERIDKEIAETQRLVYIVRDRCIHSVVRPELYVGLSPSAQNELYLYWTTLAQFNSESWCEYYTLGAGYSKFFMVNSRKTQETVGLEFEMFSLLRRFANIFSFESEKDQELFSLYLDGFDPVCIADYMGQTKKYVEKKIAAFTEIALQHREQFFKLSLLEQEDILREEQDEGN